MTEAEEKKKYLEEMIFNSLTMKSDEYEGQQVIDLTNINLCSSDNDLTHENPYYTSTEINDMFHFNDPDVNKNQVDDNGYIDNDSDAGGGKSSSHSSIINNGATSDANNIPGTDSAGISGDKGDNKENTNSSSTEHNTDDFSTISIPDNTDIDDLIKTIINDKNTGTNHAVIEFSTPCLTDDIGVDYKLSIKPGERITKDTIIGTVTQNGESRTIRSIFSDGLILADESGIDFKHIYKGAGCTRHFIIDDYTLCGEGVDVNIDSINKINDKFKEESQIYQLLTDNLCESLLPWILTRRYTSKPSKGTMGKSKSRPNGRALYSKYLEHISDIRNTYADDMKKLSSSDNVKSKNNVKKMNALGDQIIERRRKYAEDLIYAYTDDRNSIDKCEYDENYSDCKYLAFVHSISEGQESTSTKIGNLDYNNYYMALLSKLDMTDSNPNALVKEYYDIIKRIIEIRITREVYKIDVLISEFNDLFRKTVNENIKNPEQELYKSMKEISGKITENDVLTWINGKNTLNKDEYTSYSIKQLTNMFMFMWNYKLYKVQEVNYTQNYNSFVLKKYDISETFYWYASSNYPYDRNDIGKRSFSDFENKTYKVGYESGEYSVNIYGVTCWLYEKTEDTVTLYVPAMTEEQWSTKKQIYEENVKTIYDLVCMEQNRLEEFWKKVISKFRSISLNEIIGEMNDMGHTVDKYAEWPMPSTISIGAETYEHYLFQNMNINYGTDDDEETSTDYDTKTPDIPVQMDAPDATDDDLNDGDDITDNEPTIKDFKYWQKYFWLSTIISLPYLNCGLDIPPTIMNIPLPCIFICAASMYIKVLDIVIVFGISIRGMYVWPVILFVNLSNQYANVMTPLIAQLKTIMSKISVKINTLSEKPIESIADNYINIIDNDNIRLRNENKQLESYISQIKQKKVKNHDKIKSDFERVFKPDAKMTQQVVDPLNSSQNT
jgi:hypothetical protein